MRIDASGSHSALLAAGGCLLLGAAVVSAAQAQTPGPVQAQPKPANEHKATHPAKPTPVVKPHGTTHAQKPAKQAPAAPATTPPAPAPPPPPEPPKQAETDTAKGSNTGLPLPRYAALRSDEVNLRAGPGTRYPIQWVYKRRELPVEIQREFEVWRLVQDPDGTKGWVHQATLTGRRSFIVTGADATLRRDARDASCETGGACSHDHVGVGRIRPGAGRACGRPHARA